MNSGKVGVIHSPKFRKTGLAARLLSGCFSPSALNTRQDGQFLRWGHQVLCSSTQVQDAYDLTVGPRQITDSWESTVGEIQKLKDVEEDRRLRTRQFLRAS